MTKLSSEKIFRVLSTRTRKRLQVNIQKVGSFQNLLLPIHCLVDKTKAEKDRAAKADDPKAGADIGKIVNLIDDSNRVGNIICFSCHLSSNFKF